MSGGEKQKIACASVAALLPQIILLDEPSSNLDIRSIEDLRKTIIEWKKQGKTIIVSEHRLWYLKDIADRVLYMQNGNICREWTGEEFAGFSEEQIEALKLRPLEIKTSGVGPVAEAGDGKDRLVLKDFFFSYHKKPYVFRKHKFSEADKDSLTLNIPHLEIPVGKVVGVLGNNGNGKSTFLRCLCGLEKDCRGVVSCEGKDYDSKARLSLCYMVMQDVNHQLFTDSVAAEVLLSMKTEDKERCDEILDLLGLLPYKDKHPMALSGGQKQRVAVASALAADAKILLFDEPTSGLDYEHMEIVGKLLKQLADRGHTVFVSTHDSELIEQCCDAIVYIENGKARLA